MKRILLVYPPFCTPASPPYSLTSLAAKIKREYEVNILDLNVRFHNLKFPEFHEYYQQGKFDFKEYSQTTKKYEHLTSLCYSENNKKVLKGESPELLSELLSEILKQKPEVVAFSIVYSSQAFYASVLIQELKKKGIRCFVGGPAVTHQMLEIAETDFKEFLSNKNEILDFSVYNKNDYFTPELVLPIKTCSACFYQQCAFCTHHQHSKYQEFELEYIGKAIQKSKAKKVFFIDDMITKKRLLELAEVVQPLKITWMCQLRPTKDLDRETLQKLHASGLRVVLWGVESGSPRILNLMRKGTNPEDNEITLRNAHEIGIKNVLYAMFGFPTETETEFLDTVNFLQRNKENIDLLSISTFGLQQGTPIFAHPKEFGVKKVNVLERKLLDAKVTFEVEKGLPPEELLKLRKKYRQTLDKINKYPQGMNFFREHLLCLME